MDGASLNELFSTPLLLGMLAALMFALVVLAFLRAGIARRLLVPIMVMAIVSVGALTILDRMAQDERLAERRALKQRSTELATQALAPGSVLACLDGAAGDAVENACERLVFAQPQRVVAAVAYMAARLTLLADGLAFARKADPQFAATFGGMRRAVELDRFGIAAHVLAVRDGCTAERCAAFALLHDANVIKANLKAQIFDQYVSRNAADWNNQPIVRRGTPMAEQQTGAPPSLASAAEAPAKAPVPDKYDFPSSDSIPAVSIMNPEPKLPKEAADAQAAQPAGAGEKTAPAPPKRPQPQHPAGAPLTLVR